MKIIPETKERQFRLFEREVQRLRLIGWSNIDAATRACKRIYGEKK